LYFKKHQRRLLNRKYIYRLDVFPDTFRKKEHNLRFLSIRLTRLYFLTLQDYQFRKLFRKSIKLFGNFESNYCYFLECRIASAFYRTNFLSNIFEIMRFIKAGNVLVNFNAISSLNYLLPVGSILSVPFRYKRYINQRLLERLQYGAVLFNMPRFFFISFNFLFAMLLRYPVKKDLIYPFPIDIQRITGYY